MKEYCQCVLKKDMSLDEVSMAGEVIRNLDGSPAWFLILKKVKELRAGFEVMKPPSTMTLADYGQSFGGKQACDAFLKIFDDILDEAADARKREDETRA
jgi:hypothetical protein